MTTRGYGNASPAFPEDGEGLLTMADVEAMAERLGLIIVTDGRTFEYARPGIPPRPGFRRFAMVQKPRALEPTEPQ